MSKIKPFDILSKLDANNFDYYSKLDRDDRAQVSPYMMTKWMAQSNDVTKLEVLNSTANRWVFNLSPYPEILYHVLASCGSGRSEFYTWRKKSTPPVNRPVTVRMLKEFYNDSVAVAAEDSAIMDLGSMIEIAELLGHHEDIPKLKKEYS